MKCIYCAHPESKVVDSRPLNDGAAIRRRRECLLCGKRFTTYEKAEQMPVMVIKKDGSREAFDVDKIQRGIRKACEKRNVSADTIESMALEVERRVQELAEQEVHREDGTYGEDICPHGRVDDEILTLAGGILHYRH